MLLLLLFLLMIGMKLQGLIDTQEFDVIRDGSDIKKSDVWCHRSSGQYRRLKKLGQLLVMSPLVVSFKDRPWVIRLS